MRKSQFYVPSNMQPFPDKKCGKCERLIVSVADGKMFYRAGQTGRERVRDICRECFELWQGKIAKRHARGA